MYPEVEEKAKPKFEEFKRKMKEQGYPEKLIDKAIERAKEWVEGFTRMLDHRHPELVKKAQEELLEEAISSSERWIKRLYEALTE